MPSTLSPKLPDGVHLPSGRRVRLSDVAAARARAALAKEHDGPFAEALGVLSGEGVLADAGGAPLDVYTLPVRDVHVLRALVTRAGHAREEVAEFSCENCGEPFKVAPSTLLEPAPFVDGTVAGDALTIRVGYRAEGELPAAGAPETLATIIARDARGARCSLAAL